MTKEEVARVLSPERLSGVVPASGAIDLTQLMTKDESDLT